MSRICVKSYEEAEKLADQWAGDTGQPYVVVEEFDTDDSSCAFWVGTPEWAERYTTTHDAEIQYEANPGGK